MTLLAVDESSELNFSFKDQMKKCGKWNATTIPTTTTTSTTTTTDNPQTSKYHFH